MSCVTHWFRAGRGRCSRTVPWPSVISAVWRMGGRDPEAVVSVTSDLLTVRRSHSVGDTIRLTIQRDGQSLTVDVVLYASK